MLTSLFIDAVWKPGAKPKLPGRAREDEEDYEDRFQDREGAESEDDRDRDRPQVWSPYGRHSPIPPKKEYRPVRIESATLPTKAHVSIAVLGTLIFLDAL